MDELDEMYQFSKVVEILLDYGWVLTPFIIGGDFQKIQRLISTIEGKVLSDGEKDSFKKELYVLLTDITFSVSTRSFFVFRAKEVKHIQSFSHHIERALLHYYNNDYFSTVLCLLPAIEGSLLSYYGWEFGTTRKPSISMLIKEIEKCKVATYHPKKYKMYSGFISHFLKRWIFSDTSTADITFSYLNRHYIMHGMGNNNYYSIADAQRLIMFFDLFIEFLSLEQRINYNFIPDSGENDFIDSRNNYYFRLQTIEISRKEAMETEQKFMGQNVNYYPENNIPNFKDMILRFTIEHMEFMKEHEIKFGNRKSKRSSLYKKIKNYISKISLSKNIF